jgi:coproporphyrinogen III oxidase-like Fe-S oxidoreductase
MPQSKESFTGFVLHGLLLHNGLDAASLESVTGVSAHELSLMLSRLNRAELVVYDQSCGHWQVTAIGYPAVRRHLQSWGFPVDQF